MLWLIVMGMMYSPPGSMNLRGEISEVIASGEWSAPVADNRGKALRGRLVLCQRVYSAER